MAPLAAEEGTAAAIQVAGAGASTAAALWVAGRVGLVGWGEPAVPAAMAAAVAPAAMFPDRHAAL